MGLQMRCAIKLNNCVDCTFEDAQIDDFALGIDAENSDGLLLNNVDFGSCNTGLRGRNCNDLTAKGCTHGHAKHLFPQSSLIKITDYFHYCLLYLRVYGYNPYN